MGCGYVACAVWCEWFDLFVLGGDSTILMVAVVKTFFFLVFGLACIVSRRFLFLWLWKTWADEYICVFVDRWTWSPGSAWPAGG